jgi:hypothetical protein
MGLALAATPAFAQNAWLASKMIEEMCGAKAAPGGSVDRLAERLNLTDAQKATLKDLKDAAAASAASTRTALRREARSHDSAEPARIQRKSNPSAARWNEGNRTQASGVLRQPRRQTEARHQRW